MDPLSAISGIVGLIAITTKVVQLIAEFSVLAGEHKNHAETLHTEILLLNQVLGQLKGLMDEERKHGRLTLIDDTDDNTVLGKAFKDCAKLMEQISMKLKEPTSKFQKAIVKMRWPYDQKEVFRMVQSLHRYSQLFQFSLNMTNCELLSKSFDAASDGLKLQLDNCKAIQKLSADIPQLAKTAEETLQQTETLIKLVPTFLQEVADDMREIGQSQRLAEQREQERRTAEILDWLCPLSSLQKHSDVRARRADGTGEWFLTQEQVRHWMTTDSDQYSTLLCLGDPGVGKTNLASLVVDKLFEIHGEADVAIVHLYCDYREQQAQTPQNCARSILRQLSMQINGGILPASVSEFYQSTRNEVKDQSWYIRLRNVVCRVASTFTRCFFVIDALDETESNFQRRGLLELVGTLQSGLAHQTPKIFATSRKHASSVHDFFIDSRKITVTANIDDLRIILSKIIAEHHDSKYIIDAPMKNDILTKLCAGCDGMFLLPILQTQEILSQLTKAEVRRALRDLSTNLSEAFESTIGRILSLPTDKSHAMNRRILAAKALMWISHAKRVLTVSELQHALAIRMGDSELDIENILDPQLIVDSCFGLVEIDKESSTIRFVHYSLQEYLKSHDHELFSNGDVEVTRICLKYLSLESVKDLHVKNRQSFSKAIEEMPFLDYAAKEWGYHAANISPGDVKDLAVRFLTSNPHLLTAARIRDRNSPYFRKWHERMYAWAYSEGAGISLCASFGLAEFLNLLVEGIQYPMLKARNMYGSTPLHEAAMKGYEDTTRLLLKKGADPLDQNMGKCTPLYLAVASGQITTADLLLQRQGQEQLGIPGKASRSVLQLAADIGDEDMVALLLRHTPSLNDGDEKGMTAMHMAARKGNLPVVRLLILCGADLHSQAADLLTPLDHAVTVGHLEISRLLIDNGANIEHLSADAWRPLHRAARSGHHDVVSLLLEKGANMLVEDHKGALPLHAAARSGNMLVINAFLNSRPEINRDQLAKKERRGSTPSDVAFFTAHFDIYKRLRAAGIENQTAPVTLNDKLTIAIENGKLEKVRRLIVSDSLDLNAPIDGRQPALHLATQEEQPEIVRVLLDAGADINFPGYHGGTPLHIAAAIGNVTLIRLCIARGANIHARSDTQQTALHKACSSRNLGAVTVLLDAGVDKTAQNERGMTPLHVAAHQNRLDMVKMLVDEHGVELTTRDKFGDSAMDWAERSGHLELLRYLRAAEKRRKQLGIEYRELAVKAV